MPKGLVVPDNPSPVEFITVPFRIPKDPQWIGIIAGLLHSPCYGYWWKKNSGDWELARDTMCSIASGFLMTDFCEQVAACIEDNPTILEMIENMVNQTINNYEFGDPTSNMGAGLSALDGCPPDVVFAACTALVDYIHQSILDAIEIVEVATNFLEVLNIWVGGLPVVGDVLTALSEYAAWLQDTIGENYNAQWTIALRDDLRCGLFCAWLASPTCEFSVEDMALYFVNRMGATESILNTFQDMATFALTGVWGGDQIVEIMFLTAVGMMALSSGAVPFITIPVTYSFDQVVALGSNNPDPDWSILCDDCPPTDWEAYFDFEVDNGNFITAGSGWGNLTRGNWVSGDGWNTVGGAFFSGWAAYAIIRLNFSTAATLTGMQATYNCTVTGIWSPAVNSSIQTRSTPTATSGVVNFQQLAQTTGAGTQTFGDDDFSPITAWGVGVNLWNAHRNTSSAPAANGTARVKGLRLFGTGDPPAEVIPYLV